MNTNVNTCATIIFTCALLLTPKSISAATLQAATAKQSDVQAAILHARDGDTVVVPGTLSLPGGAAIWTSRINVTVGITLRGQTTITGAGTSNPVIVNQTVILDNSPRNTNESGLLKFSLTPTQRGRVTGFTFRAGASSRQNNLGIVQLNSSGAAANYTMRVDHCYFDQVYSRCIQVLGWCMGVADHNVIHSQGSSTALYVTHAGYGNGGTRGDESWADYPYFGTNNFFFFEDNTIVGNGASGGASDGEVGARFVIRHNDWTNAKPGWHGTEGGKSRGTRCAEIYNNTSHWTMAPSASYRSGNALIHDNTWDGHDASLPYHGNIVLFRAMAACGTRGGVLGSADGHSAWDMDDTEGNGTYVQGHAPHLFASGRASATASGGTLNDATANWTPHQWIGYSVTNMNSGAAAYLKGSAITDNTRTTISYIFYSFNDRGPLLVFNGGDAYQIHRCLSVLDQPGRGKGDLCTANQSSNPINTVTGTPSWTHEIIEPSFSWNNVYKLTNTAWGFGTGFPTCKKGRDFYNLGSGFAPNSTPSQVSAILTSAVNGVPYSGTFTYPHPYAIVP